MSNLYAVVDEYKGSYVGTIDEVLNWLVENDCSYGSQRFYEIGDEVQPEIKLL